MMYLGDYLEDATVYFSFTTNAADGGRESFSASLEEADIVIFKNGAAMTLGASTITITNDIGTRTGVHMVSVDMSNDADFTTAADYSAVLYASDETLDSQAPAGVLAAWSCENRTVDVARMNGTDIGKSSDGRLQVDVAEWNDIPLSTTNPLPNAAADAAGGLPISDAGGLDMDAILNRIGAFTGSGVNTILGFFQALFRSDGSTPSDVGGTFNPSTDSVEAIRNTAPLGTAMRGTDGANTTTPPTVSAIRTEMDANSTQLAAIKLVTDLLNAADSEPTGVPAANETPLVKLAYLFMALRNQVDVTATKKQFYDDSGAVEWEKDLTDDGTTYSESEANAP